MNVATKNVDMVDYLEVEHVYSQALGKGMKSLAICAANSREGVSMLACALAERHQRSGRSTLLVDMNFFRPSIDQRFNLPRANWGVEQTSFSRAVMHLESGVNVLTASKKSAMDFRHGEAISDLVRVWESQYDAIIIDTSPLNAINRNNVPAELLCGCVQACLMIVKSAVTTDAQLINAVAKLNSHNANLLGVVMNDQECPNLSQELIRESRRLEKKLPRLTEWLISKVRASHFLNLPV